MKTIKARKTKLTPLTPHIDWSKSNIDNARILYKMARELKIPTTEKSLAVFVGRNRNGDVSIDSYDEILKSLAQMKNHMVELTNENASLRQTVENIRKFMGGK